MMRMGETLLQEQKRSRLKLVGNMNNGKIRKREGKKEKMKGRKDMVEGKEEDRIRMLQEYQMKNI